MNLRTSVVYVLCPPKSVVLNQGDFAPSPGWGIWKCLETSLTVTTGQRPEALPNALQCARRLPAENDPAPKPSAPRRSAP